MNPGWTFHHLGIACRDLDREMAMYRAIGYVPDGNDFTDPIQGVRGRFLVGGGPRLELLTSTDGSDVLDPWLRQGTRIYHQAFEVEDLSGAIEVARVAGAVLLREPVAAVAFEGRAICFAMFPNLVLIEFIAAPDAGRPSIG